MSIRYLRYPNHGDLFIDYKHTWICRIDALSMTLYPAKVYDLLKPNTGRSIEEIGGLELEP